MVLSEWCASRSETVRVLCSLRASQHPERKMWSCGQGRTGVTRGMRRGAKSMLWLGMGTSIAFTLLWSTQFNPYWIPVAPVLMIISNHSMVSVLSLWLRACFDEYFLYSFYDIYSVILATQSMFFCSRYRSLNFGDACVLASIPASHPCQMSHSSHSTQS